MSEVLSRLNALVGDWETEATFAAGFFGPGSPAVRGRGRTTFEWLEGEFFLIQRASADDPGAPSAIMIIGLGEASEGLEQHYYDAPGFWQRYTGAFSEDGRTITGAWEKSADGARWQHDFDLNYVKAG